MQKLYKLILGLFSILAVGCGGGSGSSAGGSVVPPSTSWPSYSIANAAALPTCTSDLVGRLYYIEDTAIFQACKSTGWATIDVGNDIVSIKQISSSPTDWATQYTGEAFYLMSGQVIKYKSGIYAVTISTNYIFAISGDTDFDGQSETKMIPPNGTYNYGVYPSLARGAGYKGLYASFDTATSILKYYADTNGDGLITGADELLFTPTLTTLYP